MHKRMNMRPVSAVSVVCKLACRRQMVTIPAYGERHAARRGRLAAHSSWRMFWRLSATVAVQAGLQAADGDDTGIWRTPCSEKEPHRGAFELAHVREIIGSSQIFYLRRFLYGNNKVGCQQDAQNR